MALKVGELYALFSIQTSEAIKSLNGVQTQIDAIGDNIISIGHLWESNITRPLVGWGKNMLQTGMDFGDEMAKTTAKALLDLDPEEQKAAYEALENEVLRVAKASEFTSVEMAGAIDKMSMAGWDWRSMVGGLEPIADLASASGDSLVETADIVTDAMTAYGLTWEKALAEADGDSDKAIGIFQGYVEHFTDVLATAATSSNTDVHMMGESFKYAAAMAGALNYEADDTAVALAMMANRGIKAGQAGTSLRRIMSNLVSPPNTDTAMIIDQLGISLYDAETGMFDLMGVIEQLREKINGSDMGAQLILGIRDLWEKFWDSDAVDKYDKQWDKFYDEGKQAYNDYIKTLKDGEQPLKTLDDFVEELMDPSVLQAYNEQLEVLNKNIQNLSASEGEKPQELKVLELISEIAGVRALPALVGIVTASDEEFYGLADAIDNAEGSTRKMKETMLDTTGGSLKMLYSSLDTLKVVLEKLVDDKLRDMIDSIRELVNAFIDMDEDTQMTILNMAGIASAIGPALVGIGMLTKLLPLLGSAFNFVASPMGLVATALGAMAISALDSEGKISKAMGDMGKALGLEELDIGELDATELLDGFLNDLGDLSSNPAVTGFMERLGEGFKASMGYMGDLAGDIVGYIFSAEGALKIFKAGGSIIKLIVAGFESGWKGLWEFGRNFWQSLEENINDTGEGFKLNVKGNLDGDYFATSLSDAATYLAGHMHGIFGDDFWNAMYQENGMKRFNSWEAKDNAEEWANQLLDTYKKAIDKAGFIKLWEEFEDEYDKNDFVSKPDWTGLGYADAGEWWGYVYDAMKEGYENQNWGYLLELMAGIGSVMTEQINEEAEELSDTAQKAFNEVYAQEFGTGEEKKAFSKASDDAIEGMTTTLADGKDKVADASAHVSNEAVQAFLLTMSKENGAAVALEYLGGLEEGLMDDAAVQALAAAAISTSGGVVTIFETILSPGVGRSIGSAFGNAIAGAISAASWGIDAQVQEILSSVNAASLAAQEAVAGLVVPSRLASSSGLSSGGAGSIDYDAMGRSLADGLISSGAVGNVYLDKQKVGDIITPTVSENIAAQSVRRG